MKITLSRKQWEMVGQKSGWMKKEAVEQTLPPNPHTTGNQQERHDYSKMTFERLMQDPNFKAQYDNIKQQQKWQLQIFNGWKKLGIPMNSPEMVDLWRGHDVL
jgi:hypothetical protein